VKKAVRVGEEVVVRKDISERTETVRDEVRRDQVEVQEPTQRKE
jgi:stress response protein YsnF